MADVKENGDTPIKPAFRKRDSWKGVSVVLILFAGSVFAMYSLFMRLPKLHGDEWQYIKFPRSLEESKALGLVLSRYTDQYYWEVLIGITVVYIFLQAFMIPGSVAFSVLLGYLFSFPLALFIICLCSSIGASCCFIIAKFVGGKFVFHFFPERVVWCQNITAGYKRHMFVYIFCLRVAPYIPNWLVNITSPVLNVPLTHFFVGTFFGVIPLSLLFVNAGTTLQQLTSLGLNSVTSAYTLPVFTVISVLPFIFKQQLKEKFL